ncbi:MAG: type IX secretion system protein PorQ [Muribaculaceae bacterium]|nr:type IX secretion system protein PorQ [Muribaculaceae bacterium]
MKRTLTTFATGCCLFSSYLAAQNSSSAYDFLDISTSTHAYALGSKNVAIVDPDVTLVDQNPALLGPEVDNQIAFNYMHYMGSGNFAGLRYGMGAGERGAWALGIRYLNYGSIQGYEPDGTMTGKFSPADMVVEGTYSHDFNDRLRGGINLKMVYSTYEQYTAFAMAVDLGINYYNEEKDLSLSAVISNAGGQLKRFDREYARLPFDIRLGYMQSLGASPFQLSINATHLTKWRLPYYAHDKNEPDKGEVLKSSFLSNLFRHLIFGLQYSPSEKFYIGIGYDYKMRTDMATYNRNFLSGFTVGAGLRVKSFGVGISYAMPHKSASSLMLNLSCSIGQLVYGSD